MEIQASRGERGDSMRRRTSLGAWLLGLLALGGISCTDCLAECAVGIKTPGRTWPAGDIVLEYGNPLRIQCLLNETFLASSPFRGKNSSDLVFFKNYREIESEFITVLNETAIQLDISKPPPEDATYYCKLRLDAGQHDRDFEGVCLNKVVVGFKPEQPLEFECISRNWENLTCSWQPPPNYVDTTYTISFKLPGRAGGRMVLPCPSEQLKEKSRNSCFWDSSTNPIYRQPYEHYTFFLQGENVLGNWSGSYKFHHFANVIPARPTNLTIVNKTTNSALLHWSVSFPMQNFPAGLHHRVAHQNQWDRRDTWQVINITDDIHTAKRYFNLTGLRYANAIYDVRVFIKSAAAVGEDKWSNFSDITFRTLPTVPGQAPRTDYGSFQIDGLQKNREVYLYWQTIPDYLENGEGFSYVVSLVEENGRRLYLEPSEVTRSYAKFRGLSYNNSYKFEIVASNEVGVLEQPAKIFVPSLQTIPKEPTAFTKIAFDDGLYELSWKPPTNGAQDITNYTIFWCQNERDWPYQCNGYLDWVHVSRSTRMHNITVPDPNKVYQFAISANTARGSSGMMWASCTVIHNKVEGKMKSVWRNHLDSTFIEVGWKLDCSDRIGFVEGFKIYYCPITSPYNTTCRDPRLNTTIKADLNTIRGTIKGLKPYTTYMISVAVLTKSGESQPSDPLFATTLEDKPSDPPRDVRIRNVTNNTMYIEWKKPVEKNGLIRIYQVHYNNELKKIDEAEDVEPHVLLTNLRAHQEYTIRVSACTVHCSDLSEPVYVQTGIGVPGEIQSPGFTFVNSSQVKVTWHRPYLSAGPLDYYQIKDNSGKIQNTTGNSALISIPDCKTDGAERLYRFQVRAVNIAPNNEHLFGNWSDTGESNCYSTGPSYRVWVVIWVIGSICGIAFVFCVAYSSKRVWMKCKAMQDVEVKLPPGLAPNMKLLQKSGEQHHRQSSADSSGCSSGQESVTSSLTSDSQVSSDSGADVDPVLSSKKQLVLDAASEAENGRGAPGANGAGEAWESSSLRQRNVSGSSCRPGIHQQMEPTRWGDPYVKVAKGSDELIAPDSLSIARSTPNLNESAGGFAGSHQTWSSTGYISMPSSEELSSNPSPVPKEILNPTSYCIVGVTSGVSPSRSGSEEEAMSLAKPGTDTVVKPTINPYVSLASFEQKSKENVKRTLDALRVFNDMNFGKPSLQQLDVKTSTPTRPYVQTGSLESMQKSQQQPNFFAQACLAEELSSKLSPQLPESKPYVTVASLNETRKLPPPMSTTYVSNEQQPPVSSKGYIPVSSLMNEAKPMLVPTCLDTPVCNESQRDNGLYPPLDLEPRIEDSREVAMDDDDDDDTSSITSSSTTASTVPRFGLSMMQTTLEQEQPKNKSSSGYVSLPDQKSGPWSGKPQPVAKSDEQYSKVTVVPRAAH